MKRVQNVKVPVDSDLNQIKFKVAKTAGIKEDRIKYFKIVKKSLDARDKGNIFYLVTADVSTSFEKEAVKEYKKVTKNANVLVVGAGPAGLFCALELLRAGLNVTLIERGLSVDERSKSVDHFIKTKELDEDSNIQFGEGGAGTFSDGKLNTSIKSEYIKEVLSDFVKFGAPSEIEYINKPHIGSDNLPKVVKNIRNEIIRLGGKVLFSTKLVDFSINNNKIVSVTLNNKVEVYDDIVLAVGHSARDVFKLCLNKGVFIEPKEFAVGFRIEHLKDDINLSQYGEKYYNLKCMPTADYKLTSSYNGRGAFTFCMCPGGYVMPSQSVKETIVTNGMSNYTRNNVNSNSAVIVQVKLKDFAPGVLGGVEYQESLEKQAFILGGGDYLAPVQLVGDYLKKQNSSNFGKVLPSFPMGVKKTNLNGFFNEEIESALKYAITDMGKRLKGFDSYDSVLTSVESRTSSPVRILRTENFNSVNVTNLYPCGEGCGYAGGITSAGVDGKRVASSIINKYL